MGREKLYKHVAYKKHWRGGGGGRGFPHHVIIGVIFSFRVTEEVLNKKHRLLAHIAASA